jgi:hypothetical protein
VTATGATGTDPRTARRPRSTRRRGTRRRSSHPASCRRPRRDPVASSREPENWCADERGDPDAAPGRPRPTRSRCYTPCRVLLPRNGLDDRLDLLAVGTVPFGPVHLVRHRRLSGRTCSCVHGRSTTGRACDHPVPHRTRPRLDEPSVPRRPQRQCRTK